MNENEAGGAVYKDQQCTQIHNSFSIGLSEFLQIYFSMHFFGLIFKKRFF